MKDKKDKPGNKSRKQPDNEMALQKELARESAEGADSVGDVGSNRTLTGSSTWETLPDASKAPAPTKGKGKGKPPEKTRGSAGTEKKRR